VLLALTMAGCGSSASSGLSKSKLASKVDAICKTHNVVISAAASKMLAGGKLPSPKAFGKLAFGTIIPQTSKEISSLSALKPQSSLSRPYQTWLAELRADVAKMKTNPVIIQSSSSFVTVNHAATAQGFSSNCDVGPSS
jgi:hypothetical protein